LLLCKPGMEACASYIASEILVNRFHTPVLIVTEGGGSVNDTNVFMLVCTPLKTFALRW
jgi:hypothetical protein